MNILGMHFPAKFGEIFNLRSSMLILTVFPNKCVKLSPYLDKLFPYLSQVNSVELSQDFMIAPYSRRNLTRIAKDENQHLFREGTVSAYTKMFSTLEFILVMSIVHMLKQSTPLMLNNPNPNSNIIKKGLLGCTLLDCTQKMTQTLSVIDNVAFVDFVKLFDPELINDLHVCATKP